eukprot:gene4885-21216_t
MSRKLFVAVPQALHQAREYYKKLFGKYLFITNTVSYVTLFGLGDALTQLMERRMRGEDRNHDFRRSLCVIAFASFQGPVNHFWYLGLDKFIKGTIHRTVFKKVLADQLVFAPYACTSFYLGLGLLEGQTLKTTVSETKEKFLPTYIADLSVWPAAQFVYDNMSNTEVLLSNFTIVQLVKDHFDAELKKVAIGTTENEAYNIFSIRIDEKIISL